MQPNLTLLGQKSLVEMFHLGEMNALRVGQQQVLK